MFPCDSIRPRRGGHGSENPGSLDAGTTMRSTHLPGAMIAVAASGMSLTFCAVGSGLILEIVSNGPR
jgi:hypothetical protein